MYIYRLVVTKSKSKSKSKEQSTRCLICYVEALASHILFISTVGNALPIFIFTSETNQNVLRELIVSR